MTNEAKRMPDAINRYKEMERQEQFSEWKISQELAQKFCEDMKEHYPFLELKPVEEDIEKIKTDRLEYGYDSLCLRVDQLVNELAEMAYMLKGRSEGNDIAHYKRFYGMRAMRIYEILDDLLDGKGHTDHGKHV